MNKIFLLGMVLVSLVLGGCDSQYELPFQEFKGCIGYAIDSQYRQILRCPDGVYEVAAGNISNNKTTRKIKIWDIKDFGGENKDCEK